MNHKGICVGILLCLNLHELHAIQMNEKLPKDLYDYEIPVPDPIPEESPKEEPPEIAISEELNQDPHENQDNETFDSAEYTELEEKLNVLKQRRDSIEQQRHQNIKKKKIEPKDNTYGLESDTLGFSVDRYKMITADRYIPCITENSINSELPGRVIVVVERNVFAHKGRNILIPKGSRMICGYDKTKSGQTRLSLKCRRLITPTGAQALLADAPGADVMGRSGLAAYVDNRFIEQFGAALLVASLEGGIGIGKQLLSKNETLAFLNNTSLNVAQQESPFIQIINKMLEKNGNLDPIVMVPSGTRMLMIPTKDIIMKQIEGDDDYEN
jgi:type IV secretion system protein VirB10